MLALWTKVTGWIQSEKGASMVEYALLVVLIAIVALVAVQIAGTRGLKRPSPRWPQASKTSKSID